jgi:phosphohistidine phosphatase
MIRDLLLMHHGHLNDDDKLKPELSDKGKRNAQRMGVWLAANELLPDHIICSPVDHVKTTAEKTSKTSGLNANNIQIKKNLVDASASGVIDIIKACPEKAMRVLLVGNNPSLESVLSKLSRTDVPKTKKDKILSPAALAHLRIDCSWSKISDSCAELSQIVYPKKLPSLFPYPDVNGREGRVRPAYYYRQSCVIPYRIKKHRPEILIISSSSGKHWVVPKGIHDPGLSAQESAANEAYEEAGVEGRVTTREIGCYQYAKWEATCKVSVYPMEVSHMLDEKDWEERHRGRRWVTLEEAVKLINNPDLANIIARLPDFIGRYKK